jgi:hypothetical protein
METTFIYSITPSRYGDTPEANVEQDEKDILRRLRSLEAISYETDNIIIFQLAGYGSKWVLSSKGRLREGIPGIAKQAAGVLHGLIGDDFYVTAEGEIV